jgi:uncharacterized membrane protein
MSTLAVVLAVLLAVTFLPAPVIVLGARSRATFRRFGYPDWFLVFTAVWEVGLAVLLLVAVAVEDLAPVAFALVAVTMAVALASHLRVRDSVAETAPSAVVLALAVAGLVASL